MQLAIVDLTSEFTGLRGFSRRSGGMMGWGYSTSVNAS